MVGLFGMEVFLNYQCHFKNNHNNYQFLLNVGWVPSLKVHGASLENT